MRNSHIVVNSGGDIVSVYHKVHMFDVDIPEKNTRIMESDYVLPGEKIVAPVETPVGKVGLAIVSFSCGVITSVSPNSCHYKPFIPFQAFFMCRTDMSNVEMNCTCLSLVLQTRVK